MDVDDKALEGVQRRHAGHVVAMGDDRRLDARLPQGRLDQPVEVRGEDDPYVPAGHQPHDGLVRLCGLLHPALPFALVRLEEGVKQRPTLEGGGRQGREQSVVGGFMTEPRIVPGVRFGDLGLALDGRHLCDEFLLDVVGRRHA